MLICYCNAIISAKTYTNDYISPSLQFLYLLYSTYLMSRPLISQSTYAYYVYFVFVLPWFLFSFIHGHTSTICAHNRNESMWRTLTAQGRAKIYAWKVQYYSAIAVTCWAKQTHSTLCIRNAVVIYTKALAIFTLTHIEICYIKHYCLLNWIVVFVVQYTQCCWRYKRCAATDKI